VIMSLQKICDSTEEKFPITIQIKREERPCYAGHATYVHLVVHTNDGRKFTSQDVLSEVHLSWWLQGLITGIFLEGKE
jgi:hypothetical protein